MEQKKMMNIATAANGAYVKYLIVMLDSLFRNNLDTHVNIYVLNNGFTDEEAELLRSVCKGTNNQIIPLYVDDRVFGDVDRTSFTIEAYLRLAMFELLPDEVERILYLDVDIIVQHSLDGLYNVDFGDKLVAACSHQLSEAEIIEGVNSGKIRPERGSIFNSGVVLYNVKEIKKKYGMSDFLRVINTTDYYYDQGILNYIFWDKALYMDTLTYNNRGYKGININDIVIIHYAAGNPWELSLSDNELDTIKNFALLDKVRETYLNEFYMKLINIWWLYAKNTIVYENLLEESRIMKNYFVKRMIPLMIGVNRSYCRANGDAQIVKCVNQYGSIAKCFKQKGISECAIYGMGSAGQYVCKDLLANHFDVRFYMDRKRYTNIELEYRWVDEIRDVNIPIVICVTYDAERIKLFVEQHTNAKVILLSELL